MLQQPKVDPARSRPLSEARSPSFTHLEDVGVQVFSTCPESRRAGDDYVERVVEIARWSDAVGCRGMLIYTDNGLVDPWLLAHLVLRNTERLCPLVAVQPIYMHPYAAAKMVASLAFLHRRRIYLNMVAGGFRNDLLALDDPTEHDDRYDRLVEYTTIIHGVLRSRGSFSFAGKYYRVKNLKMTPPVPDDLMPGTLVSGSSDAGLEAARAIGAVAVKYPRPPAEENARAPSEAIDFGMRVGIIARETSREAWDVAYELFPNSRKGQITHSLAMKTSDSSWHEQLSELGEYTAEHESPYWLGPFENYKTFCPYLVGSYEVVSGELRAYLERGFRTFILDIPPSQEELLHTSRAFTTAADAVLF
jgi:alkanesulfonate monooxygenase